MDNFIQSVLKFAKPNEPSFTLTDVSVVMRETLYLLGPRIRQNKIEVTEKYQPKAGAVQADPDQLKQVFMNIILNAMDAMPDGGELTVETKVKNEEIKGVMKKVLEISISDTGPGISDEIKNTLFDPFVKNKDYGVGLGLSITQQIIDLHQGKILADNNIEKGAIFIIYLPFEV
jgi:two-component system NtrC family sensor kinase